MRKIPTSTYRLQLHAGFNFDDASAIADYLWALGISHVYTSPYLQTAPDSKHGYDVADFKSVNSELGGASAHQRFCLRLGDNGLGQILDIVPNHMSLAANNPYWRDVLENGPASRYASYFDMDWEAGEERMRNKVLLPVLGDQYGVVLSSGSIQVERTGKRFEIVHAGGRAPVSPASLAKFLIPAAQKLRSEKLAFLADSFAGLRWRDGDDHRSVLRQQRDRAVLISLLDDYLTQQTGGLDAVDEAIAAINRDPDALDDFLEQQNYRLAYWRAADQDLGYRRFFDVNTLIGVRVEREHVFLETHDLILDWLRRGVLDGVRADHADGLRDPQRYFERLREHAPDAYIVAEKILAREETLPEAWPVEGTTGYEFLNLVNGLLVNPAGLERLGSIYERILGQPSDFPALVHEKKIAVTAEALGSDVNWLTSIFVQICESDRNHRDHTRAHIRHAIREIAACFSVYRTYLSPERVNVPELDAAAIQSAIDAGAKHRPDIDRGLYDFIGDVLLLRRKGPLESDFLLRFQQFTSPVMAKGLEDTALYCYNRLIGLNDVGSNPSNPIYSIEEFHRYNTHLQQHHPLSMLALTTHDTKRGEDVRARLLVLSEMTDELEETVQRWFKSNDRFHTANMPDANTEYFYYQTLIGAWPIDEERAFAYMTKATREAKEQTSWVHNNKKFEDALKLFIHRTLSAEEFRSDVDSFVEKVDKAGCINSLTQTLLKYTVPGVPDLYQGSELWDYRLVDPDNRTPVDFDLRRRLLSEVENISAEETLDRVREGLPKLFTVHRALHARRRMPECFGAAGHYTPIMATGEKSDHLIAFSRGSSVVTVVQRFSMLLSDAWLETRIILPAGQWKNEFTGAKYHGGPILIQDLLTQFPVALLTRED